MYFRSIISAVVAIAACSSSLQGVEASAASPSLTVKDFASNIANGATFVKFYSPQCAHSQKLAPMWEQVAAEHKDWKRTKGFKFAEVDCIAQGGLCEDNDVVSYPTMRLYYKGMPAAKYSKKRSVETISEYVATMAAEYINVPKDVKIEEVGEVKVNALGKVVDLDIESFERRTQFGPWLIEYYAPWCGHCKNLAPIYDEVAVALKDKVNVAKVDCTKNEEICRKEHVPGFPTIKLHQYGHSIEFREQRSLESITEWCLGAIVPSVQPISLVDLPKVKSANDVAFIFIHDANTSPEITSQIEKQSQIFYKQIALHESSEPELARELSASSPSLIALKNNRQYTYSGSLTDTKAVQAWIRHGMKPLVTTLGNHNVGSVLSRPGWVVLGLFDPANTASVAARHELIETAYKYYTSLEGRTHLDDRPLEFVIMDASNWESYVRGAFNLELTDLPVVVVINSREEIYYPFGLDGRLVPVDQEALLTYIADIERGVLVSKSMLSPIQKGFRLVQRRAQTMTRYAKQYPTVAMLLGTAFALSIMRHFGGKVPEKGEEEEEKDKKDKKE
ncbi:hypothetical protein BG011_006947 [Mortierella polycephala]|uniref:Thioredoxin domain-containing protein n=1 Tax=Mortierella polycephala TaxID=41804 RepID=A0A9P6PRE0_9FUNG|nr:hypothetical protein BG011_006947 [Mortierella polycephala]